MVSSPNDGCFLRLLILLIGDIFFWLELNFALVLVWFSNLQLLWKFLRLFETICAGAFLFCFCENSFSRRAKKTQTRKNRKNDIP